MEKNKSIKIAIVDDHQIVIDGLVAALANFPEIEIVATSSDGSEMLRLMNNETVHVLLTDLVMPKMSGQELCKTAKSLFSNVAIIALSMNGDATLINQLINEEIIDGYLFKYCGISELVIAIETVSNGTEYFQREVLEELENQRKRENLVFKFRLTNREKQIISLMEKDYSNKQISTNLEISVRTVETHRKNIFRKTNTNNLLTLVKWAYEHKIL